MALKVWNLAMMMLVKIWSLEMTTAVIEDGAKESPEFLPQEEKDEFLS